MNKLSRGELIVLVRRLMNPLPGDVDADHERLADEISSAVADPHIIDYIFQDSEFRSAEEIVDKALAYKPIVL
ncbi:hypothetical protein [Mycobacterium sp. ST-F2]|uniref:hypothetical protein n=1 Tax=Mycobacterium sp. ST-F2 TaxID=1490484 RepID=UPI00114E4D33|nr:hypothetical protein [Mycobacterium sp. ST-F2]